MVFTNPIFFNLTFIMKNARSQINFSLSQFCDVQ